MGSFPRTPIKGTRRQRTVYGIQIRGSACVYCGKPAVNGEHVIPRALVRKYNATAPEEAPSIPAEWLVVEPSCFNCNIRKGTRRLVPPSWKHRIAAMNRFFGGVEWRIWSGDPADPAYAKAWTR